MEPTNTMRYKNYTAQVAYSNLKDCLNGKVLGMKSLPTFCAKTVDGLREEFQKVIDEYLLCCEESGKKPTRAFNGQLTVRVNPAIQEALTYYAVSQGTVVTQVVLAAISEFMENHDIELPTAGGEG